MRAERTAVEGNPFVGLFARCSDRFALIPRSAPEKFAAKCRSALGAEVVRLSVAGSNLVGIFTAMNSSGLVLPSVAFSREALEAKRALGVNVVTLRGDFTAVGNNVLANDRGAVINPDISAGDAKRIADCLDVEVQKRRIAGYSTVGAVAVVTNRGLLVHPDVPDEEMEELEEFFGVRGGGGTGNLGVPFVGLCVLANSNGCVVGELTSGHELGRMTEALGFVG